MVRSSQMRRGEVAEREAVLASMPWYVRLLVDQSPCGFNAGDANLYRYVGNDPTNATDPTGQFLVFENEATAKKFVEELKVKGAEIVKGSEGAYVILGPEDRDAAFAYADKKFKDIFDPKFEGKTSLKELAERRNTFLIAAGVAGNFAGEGKAGWCLKPIARGRENRVQSRQNAAGAELPALQRKPNAGYNLRRRAMALRHHPKPASSNIGVTSTVSEWRRVKKT